MPLIGWGSRRAWRELAQAAKETAAAAQSANEAATAAQRSAEAITAVSEKAHQAFNEATDRERVAEESDRRDTIVRTVVAVIVSVFSLVLAATLASQAAFAFETPVPELADYGSVGVLVTSDGRNDVDGDALLTIGLDMQMSQPGELVGSVDQSPPFDQPDFDQPPAQVDIQLFFHPELVGQGFALVLFGNAVLMNAESEGAKIKVLEDACKRDPQVVQELWGHSTPHEKCQVITGQIPRENHYTLETAVPQAWMTFLRPRLR